MRWLGLRSAICLCIVLVAVNSAIYKTTAQQSVLTVSADKQLGPISPYVYGANFAQDPVVPLESVDLATASGVTYFRYPPGRQVDSVGVQNYQVDLLVKFAQKIHAEPSLAVRLRKGTPQDAADLVKYANVDNQYGIKYWSIGNEPDLYSQQFPDKAGYTVDQFNKDWREIAQAMLAVDPTITLLGPEISQYPPPGDPGGANFRSWLTSFLKANGDLVGVVTIHRYPFPTGDNPGLAIKDVMGNGREWDQIIPDLRKLIKDTTNRDIPIGITEVNSHWNDSVVGAEASPESFYNAIWWADSLGRIINQQVSIVAFFLYYTPSSQSGSGILDRGSARPVYYVYQLYKQFGDTLLSTTSTDTYVGITAALRKDGALTVMVVNPTTEDKSLTFSAAGATLSGTAELWRLDPKHNAEKIGSTSELSSGTLKLPAESVSLYIVPGVGSSVTSTSAATSAATTAATP